MLIRSSDLSTSFLMSEDNEGLVSDNQSRIIISPHIILFRKTFSLDNSEVERSIDSLVARMESETLRWVVSWLATISTIGLFLTGISLVLKVRRQGDTKDVTMVPFLVTIANCAFWLKYGLMTQDSTLITVNMTGMMVEVVYLIYYYSYTGLTTRRPVTRQIGAFFTCVGILFYVAVYQTASPVVAIGYVGSCTAMGVYGSPLATVAQVIRQRSSEFMSFPLSVAGLLVSVEWLIYGLLLGDNFLIWPNVVGVLLGMFQMALFGKYPSNVKPSIPI